MKIFQPRGRAAEGAHACASALGSVRHERSAPMKIRPAAKCPPVEVQRGALVAPDILRVEASASSSVECRTRQCAGSTESFMPSERSIASSLFLPLLPARSGRGRGKPRRQSAASASSVFQQPSAVADRQQRQRASAVNVYARYRSRQQARRRPRAPNAAEIMPAVRARPSHHVQTALHRANVAATLHAYIKSAGMAQK